MNDTQQTTEEEHMVFMQQALDEALSDDCVPVQTAFCVGCVLVSRMPGMEPVTLATGYSRELPGNTHAEANALTKALSLSERRLTALFPWASPTPSIEDLLRHADVYTTLEPCSIRTSGLPACADTLIQAGIKRCIIGVGEPDDFVKCEGAQKLRNAGIDVVWLSGLEQQCLDVARRGHTRA
ncbi:diaminohydroxyphosphoribosylamino-pyrimidine deaminase [Boletus coccyginus]|nr:diaminohydroxyphosphoribosylamino-pyrimidine deaminase [Boletus coccyginus]